jgi:hypothetical protein
MGKPLDIRFKLRVVAKAQEDHAAMGEALPKDQLTKVSVIGNKDAFLSQRALREIASTSSSGKPDGYLPPIRVASWPRARR